MAESQAMFEVLSRKSTIVDGHKVIAAGGGGAKGLGIELSNVTFGYGDGRDILKGVSFKVAPGESIGVVGPSGSGKSTLLRLILRMYDPVSGAVLVDGTLPQTPAHSCQRSAHLCTYTERSPAQRAKVAAPPLPVSAPQRSAFPPVHVARLLPHPLRPHLRPAGVDAKDVSLASFRAAAAVVPQECALFNTTLLDNIAYGRNGASREEARAAADAAQLTAALKALPSGLDTVVGERGVKLSGGEKQRVVCTHALLTPLSYSSHASQAVRYPRTHLPPPRNGHLIYFSVHRSLPVSGDCKGDSSEPAPAALRRGDIGARLGHRGGDPRVAQGGGVGQNSDLRRPPPLDRSVRPVLSRRHRAPGAVICPLSDAGGCSHRADSPPRVPLRAQPLRQDYRPRQGNGRRDWVARRPFGSRRPLLPHVGVAAGRGG